MSLVRRKYGENNLWMWQLAERAANRHPNICRLGVVPMAIHQLFTTSLAISFSCVEDVYRTCKSIYVTHTEINPLKALKERQWSWHCLKLTARSLILFPTSPLAVLIISIGVSALFLLSPLKTAKIEVAREKINLFIESQGYERLDVEDSFQLETYASRIKFANSAFLRFEKRIENENNNEILNYLSFLQNANSEQDLIDEVNVKNERLQAAKQVYLRNLDILQNAEEDALRRLNKKWLKFQSKLVVAQRAQIPFINFIPPR